MKRPNGTPPDDAQYNFTDPESRIMKTSTGGYEQCFNTQIAVDEKAQIIVAADVTQSAADVNQLVPMVERAGRNAGRLPKHLLADAGYRSESNFARLEEMEIKALVSLGHREETREKAKSAGPATRRMHRRLKGNRGRSRFKKRKHIVEPVFGWVKQVLGFRNFSMRGLANSTGEWHLVALATNLRRMNTMLAWE